MGYSVYAKSTKCASIKVILDAIFSALHFTRVIFNTAGITLHEENKKGDKIFAHIPTNAFCEWNVTDTLYMGWGNHTDAITKKMKTGVCLTLYVENIGRGLSVTVDLPGGSDITYKIKTESISPGIMPSIYCDEFHPICKKTMGGALLDVKGTFINLVRKDNKIFVSSDDCDEGLVAKIYGVLSYGPDASHKISGCRLAGLNKNFNTFDKAEICLAKNKNLAFKFYQDATDGYMILWFM